ncbi:hybrid sensor histidine kinase/response regulator [Pseudanabaena sp. PCC 6802]|uniref:hybrid sensor histidine kinase/response regulator n=1 Tax=Pseudanabaena sp. PCC 6802 TaxID=118173 RepID=UPI00034B2334|nr:hybrid sensor histidine kinase/response regulator [Pseudanabaena sp. PCC 6802]
MSNLDNKSTPGTILVVDDNPNNLSVLVSLLREFGYKTLVAEDGESAIAQIPYARPDIILLDVMMPGIDGFETCERLKATPDTAEIPIIFMTALADTIDKVRGFNLGAVDYITKPFDREEVLVRLKTHLTIQKLNLSLKQEIEERKRAEKALWVFLHAVSHDLRNPVTGMNMVLQNFLEESDDKISINRGVVERMTQSNNRLLNLIDSLLESHANDIQGIALKCQPVKLSEIVQGAVYDLEPILRENHTTLLNQVSPDLPNVNVDALQVGRVFQNLIANAVKHNAPNLNLKITAHPHTTEDKVEAPPQMLICTVEDNGTGVSPEQCESMFELYAQGASKRRSLGLGLGLYICKQIVDAHGGSIGIKSEVNVGSQFWFTLPIANPPVA